MREKDSGIVNGHSGIVNTDYGKSIKVFTIPPEPVFTMDQNSCSQCVRIGVHVRPEYADGQFELKTPRDRNGDFEPELVKKNQRRFTSMSDKIFFYTHKG